MSVAIHTTHILIVEPSDQDTPMTMERIGSEGVSIRTLKGGAGVMDYLSGKGPYRDRDKYPKPDLVIFDVLMPRVECIDLSQDLIAEKAMHTTAVVAIHTSEFGEEFKEAYAGELTGFVSRPINRVEYHQRVRDIIAYWTADENGHREPSNLIKAMDQAERFHQLLSDHGRDEIQRTQTPDDIKNKRLHPRYAYVEKAPICSVIMEPMTVKGTLVDFSRSGCRILIDEPIFEVGDSVILQILVPEQQPFQIRGIVRHCNCSMDFENFQHPNICKEKCVGISII